MIVLAAQTCGTSAALAGRENRPCVALFGSVARRYEAIGEIGFTEAAAHERFRSVLNGLLPASGFADAIREGETFYDEAAIEAALRCVEKA